MSVLTSLKIIDYIDEFDKRWSWCDWLRLSYKNSSDFIEDKICLFDIDNSNFWSIDFKWIDFTIQKIPCVLWIALTFSCSYNDVSVPCFQFVKFNENSRFITNSYWKLDFYWSFFRLIDMWFFEKSIFIDIINKIWEENPKVTRFDYRLDFFSYTTRKIPSIDSFLWYIHIQSKTQEMKSWWELTNWYVWSKKNWRYAIRYYDKLLDTDSKQKVFLYQDYYLYNSVHRLEFEFQRNFLRWYTFWDFYDWVIQEKIDSILWISIDKYNWSIFYQYQDNFVITDKNRSSYLKRYSTSSVRLAKNKINPLIQTYKALFYALEEDEFERNIEDFLQFIWSDMNLYKLRYEKKKQEFLNLHNIA